MVLDEDLDQLIEYEGNFNEKLEQEKAVKWGKIFTEKELRKRRIRSMSSGSLDS